MTTQARIPVTGPVAARKIQKRQEVIEAARKSLAKLPRRLPIDRINERDDLNRLIAAANDPTVAERDGVEFLD
mgnify:CR=1 FL=1